MCGTPRTVKYCAGFQERFESAYVRELYAWLAGGDNCAATAWDGYAAAAVCEAALESLHSGGPAGVRLGSQPAPYAAGADLAIR